MDSTRPPSTSTPAEPTLDPTATQHRWLQSISLIIALAFISFLIVVIGIADHGDGERWWPFIGHIPYGDKIGHLGLIGTLSLLCNIAFHPQPRPWLPRVITFTTWVLLVFLTLEEIAQAFIPTRTCDLYDWLADLAGLAVGQWLARHVRAWIARS